MKYKIVVIKESESLYIACCPVMPDIKAAGVSMDSALAGIRQEMLCYLHDPQAEFDISVEGYGRAARNENAGEILYRDIK